MKLTDEEKQEIYGELLEILHTPTREEFPKPNITAKELAALEGIEEDTAYRRLESKWKKGILEKASVRIKEGVSRSENLYWKKKKAPTD